MAVIVLFAVVANGKVGAVGGAGGDVSRWEIEAGETVAASAVAAAGSLARHLVDGLLRDSSALPALYDVAAAAVAAVGNL